MGLVELARTFVAVYERGTVTAAAAQLGISTAAASRQVTQLETEVGRRLVVRSSRGVQLTAEGDRFLPHARALLAAERDARNALDTRRPSGDLTISASVTWGLTRLVPRLGQLHVTAPDLRVMLRLEDAPADLVAEGVDVAIRAAIPPPDSTSYLARRLESVERHLVASPAWLEAAGPLEDVADLASLPAVVSDPRPSARTWRFVGPAGPTEVVVDGPLRTRTLLARKQAALAGLGATILPAFLCELELERGELLEVLPEWRVEPAVIHALFRAELREDPRVRALLDILVEARTEKTAQRGRDETPGSG